MPEHGGNLARAAADFGIAEDQWLDLSTGISPSTYPVPDIPALAWQRLPAEEAAFKRAAQEYYGTESILGVAGSQAAIQALPRLRPCSRVTLLSLTYNEYAHAWEREGHRIRKAMADELDGLIGETDVLIVCNPNNPTGQVIQPQTLLAWRELLAVRGGWLIVDEAYVDVTPELSLSSRTPLPGLIVLRSLGKFFGLAGARVGFVLAEDALLSAIREELGPWTVSGPSQVAARCALEDRRWQVQARADLRAASERLGALLAQHGMQTNGPALFRWWQDERALAVHRALAGEGILTRLFRHAEPCGIRLGLPGAAAQWQRLEHALQTSIQPGS